MKFQMRSATTDSLQDVKVTPELLRGATAVCVIEHEDEAAFCEFLRAFVQRRSENKKPLWSLYDRVKDPASVQIKIPHWRDLAQQQTDEAYLSKKRIDAISREVARIWEERLQAALSPFSDLDEGAVVDFADFSKQEVERLKLAIRNLIERYVRYIPRFKFAQDRRALERDDSVRTAIHSFRIKTGISPPEMDLPWTKLSSDQTSDPSSKENYHVPARRRAHSGRLQGTTQEGCPRKRRTPSRQANRHSARSYQARGLPDRRTGTHR